MNHAAYLRTLADWLDAHPLPEDFCAAGVSLSRIDEPRLQITGPLRSLPWPEEWQRISSTQGTTHWYAFIDGVAVVWVGPDSPNGATIADAYGGGR